MLKQKMDMAMLHYNHLKGIDDEEYDFPYIREVEVEGDVVEITATLGEQVSVYVRPKGSIDNSYPVLYLEKDYPNNHHYILKEGYPCDDIMKVIRKSLKENDIEAETMGKYEFIHFLDQVYFGRYLDSLMIPL